MNAEKLISIVRDRSPLWDMRDKRYHTRDVQRKLWQRVADEMGAKVEEVKKKWRNLRDVFRREHKKNMSHKSGDGGKSDTSSTWAFYKQMLFVANTAEPKRIHGSVSPETQAVVTMLVKEEEVSESPEEPSDLSIPHSPQPPMSTQSDMSTPQSQPWSEPGTSQQPQRAHKKPMLKRKRLEQESAEQQFLQIEKEKLKLLAESGQIKGDSHYHFLMSLDPFLKRIPMHRQLAIRNKLQQVLIDEEENLTSAVTHHHLDKPFQLQPT